MDCLLVVNTSSPVHPPPDFLLLSLSPEISLHIPSVSVPETLTAPMLAENTPIREGRIFLSLHSLMRVLNLRQKSDVDQILRIAVQRLLPAMLSMAFSSCALALPGGWTVTEATDGSGTASFARDGRTVTLAPLEGGDLTARQIGTLMLSLYRDHGFQCAELESRPGEMGFFCSRRDQDGGDEAGGMPREISFYIIMEKGRSLAASLTGGATYDDLRQILDSGSGQEDHRLAGL